jgi:hypothetical protein
MGLSQKSAQQSHEAVLFFEGQAVSREMLYAEFEALLDCVVPMRDFAGKEQRAAYVRLDAGLQLSVVVLFLIPFDRDGFPEQRWNLPLRQLAEASQRSSEPDAGGARLATRSHCPLPGWERGLWDVEHGPGGTTLQRMRDRLGMNRLGLDASRMAGEVPQGDMDLPSPESAPAPHAQRHQESAPGNQETVLALMQQNNLQVSLIREQSQREVGSMQQRLAELRQRCEELESARLAAVDDLEKLRVVFQQELEPLRKRLDAEVAEVVRLVAREGELQNTLAQTEESFVAERGVLGSELARQEEQIHSLSTELTALRRDKLRLMDEGADGFFSALKDKNVNFVTFQPGAGHVTIPVDDLSRFLEETEAYVSARCNVSPEHYRRWLHHYNNPVCQGTSGSGAPCAKPLTKILKPADFTPGLQDRCDIHKQVPRSQTMQGGKS